MRKLLLIAFILNLQACKTISNSDPLAIFGKDDRINVQENEFLSSVGYILFEDNLDKIIKCSAFLMGPELVGTASHCIDTRSLSNYFFVTGSGKRFSISKIKKIETNADSIQLQLSEKTSDFLKAGSFVEGSPLSVVSFDPFLGKLVENASIKYSWSPAPGFLIHKLDTIPSASGSPILQNGKFVGIHIGAIYQGILPQYSNYQPSPEVIASLEKLLINPDDIKANRDLVNFQEKYPKFPAIEGNIAVIFKEGIQADISSIKNRINFESLIAGATDEVNIAFSANSGYQAETAGQITGRQPVVIMNAATQTMLTAATQLAVRNGYRDDSTARCAERNTSAAARAIANEIPGNDARMFQFIGRPSLAKKQYITVIIKPLNPAFHPCPPVGSGLEFHAGAALPSTYNIIDNASGTTHIFALGINRECSERTNTLTERWANTIGHEMLHILGQLHDGTVKAADYPGRYVREFGNCIQYGSTYVRSPSLVQSAGFID